jgi:dTDP-3-amino-3,4,6-trideoxy-alpha-D-glucose transaminase
VSSIAQRIPLTEMDHCDPALMEQLLDAVQGVARRGAFTGGAAVEEFESAYARWCEAPYAVGVSSGTEALVLALRALHIGPGDEVVVPANSFIATAEAVSLVGARPRFSDVEPDTQLMSAATLRAALTPGVCAIIPVHLFGATVEMEPIMAIARERKLQVIEDCSQAHGARYRGQRVGTIGDAGTFSFYPAKNLGAWGDAGAVVTADEELASRVRLLRSHGEGPRYHHSTIGTTGRLDAIQAAVLNVKLQRLDAANQARRDAASHLRDALSDNEQLLTPPRPAEGCDHVFHQFVIRTGHRRELMEHLESNGVASAIHYPTPIHRSGAYAHLQETDVAPCAELLAEQIVSLPIFPNLGRDRARRIGELLSELPDSAP